LTLLNPHKGKNNRGMGAFFTFISHTSPQLRAGEYSEALSSITTSPPTAPSAPRALRVQSKTHNQVHLQWEQPDDTGGRYHAEYLAVLFKKDFSKSTACTCLSLLDMLFSSYRIY
jgi:hypothetical protein